MYGFRFDKNTDTNINNFKYVLSIMNDLVNLGVSICYFLFLIISNKATKDIDDGGLFIERKLKRKLP